MSTVSGILQLQNGTDARLRQLGDGLVESKDDPFVPMSLEEMAPLRQALQMTVEVVEKKAKRRRRGGGGRPVRRIAEEIVEIEGIPAKEFADRKRFEDLTPIDPQPRLNLEYEGCPPACRLIDMFCPIGFGTRGLIVAPPKAGKTILLQNIAFGIKRNHPDVELVALLIDEIDKHITMGMLAIERARRMVEAGRDVVVLLDSITRLGRAFNNSKKYASSGRTMSGGLDAKALEVPKQLFGSARKSEEGGSLTIIATCLVDTGSRADQVIFEEFKGTGNMELILDRSISEKRIFPAINLAASGTRKEDLLMGEEELKTVTALRRRLMNMKPPVQVEQLLRALERFKTNADMVKS
jgi:transcription termination factor Rho